jgi:fatty acid desaturase
MANVPSKPTPPLPPAVNGGHRSLSSAARSELKQLHGPRPGAFLWSAALTWSTIAGAIVIAESLHQWLATALALIVISTRQIALGFLLHEQAHHLGFRSRYGDLLCNLLVGYPLLLVTTEGYAQVHLSHHRYYFSDKDPDHHRKSGDEWAQPMAFRHFMLRCLLDLVGLNLLRFVTGKKLAGREAPFQRKWAAPAWLRPAYFLVAAVVFTVTGTWLQFLLYWVLPLITISQALLRFGALCEHRYNLPGSDVEVSTPLIVVPWWQRLLLPSLNFHFHVYHHYYPGVAFNSLPAVHRIFAREGLVNEANLFHGYIDYLRRGILDTPPDLNRGDARARSPIQNDNGLRSSSDAPHASATPPLSP